MSTVMACAVPVGTLLSQRQQGGSYVDCFVATVPRVVTQAQFIEAFYTTAVFAVERFILRWLVNKPSTHEQARQLARGQADTFAAWRVVQRGPNELLLEDFTGRTMSWLMVERVDVGGGEGDNAGSAPTRIYFGSAVGSRLRDAQGRASMGWVFHLLLGFHKAYSRVLLGAAFKRLVAARASASP